MKFLVKLIILCGIVYGCNYLYEKGYFDSLLSSFGNTVERTSGFVEDKAVKEADF